MEAAGAEMNAIDFKGALTPSGHINVPSEIAALVPKGEQLEIVLRWGTSDGDASWRAAGQQRFAAAYADEDSVYESLIDDPPAR